ncbi:hypothetical protein PWT90_01522 [Aphanocladium album]|nr:hypothetical protein PWT90_01522 [Aphanocladium album]
MQFTALFLSLVAVASAAPTELVARAATTCGNTHYSAGQVDEAAQTSCGYVQSRTTAGGSSYPHKYNNYEGFDFPVPGTYYEFPIKSSGKYNGGSPGADRVIINAKCQLAGVITHQGASGNNFVGNSTDSGNNNKPKPGSDGKSGNDNKSGDDSKKSAAVAAKHNLLGAAGAGAAVLLYVL